MCIVHVSPGRSVPKGDLNWDNLLLYKIRIVYSYSALICVRSASADGLIELHIFLGRERPARIDQHILLGEGGKLLRRVIVEGERPVDGGEEVVGVIAPGT